MTELKQTLPEVNIMGINPLNEAQKRYLTASLISLEKLLRQVLDLLHDTNQNEIFYAKDKDISEEISAVIEQRIFSLLEKFKEIKERYHLQSVKEKESRLVAAQLSLCWAGLLDIRPKTLSGYGSLPDSTAQELETEINTLSKTVGDLVNTLNRSNSKTI